MTTEITVRDNGPYLVEGPFTLRDAAGNEVELPTNKPRVALCRCGGSTTKPFCDGSHSTVGFAAAERAVARDEGAA
jgi:CDGSH-type Zn-finger protein